MTSTPRRRIERLVVGGGIGGLTTALALAKRGLRVHVLEKAPRFTEIGAGIQLAPNALRVLDRLGVLDAVLANAVQPPKAVLMNAVTGKPITAIDFGARFRAAYGYPYIVTHRTDVLDAVLDGCRTETLVRLETSRRVTSVCDGDDTAIVSCADGTVYETDALIGADGIWSVVRDHTVGDGEPCHVGHVAYRGTIPIDAISERAGKDNVTWWVGPAMHLVQYPVRRGELFNQVAVFEAEPVGDPEAWGPPEELDRHFLDKTSHVREGARLINRDRRWILRDRPPVDSWTRGRATLLGDAAHPMVQYLAQGACQALEDAYVLADCLADHDRDVPAAFAAYQQERLPRTAAAQRYGRLMGEIVHADGVTAMLRDELLRGREETDLRYVDWLYGYQPPSNRTAPGSPADPNPVGTVPVNGVPVGQLPIEPVRYADMPGPLRTALEPRVRRLKYLGAFFAFAARQPGALHGFHTMTEELKTALPSDLIEVVALAVATNLGSDYERSQHQRLAAKLGHPPEWIAAAAHGTPAEQLTNEQTTVRTLTLKVIDSCGKGATAELHRVVELLGQDTAIGILLLVARHVAHAHISNTLGLTEVN